MTHSIKPWMVPGALATVHCLTRATRTPETPYLNCLTLYPGQYLMFEVQEDRIGLYDPESAMVWVHPSVLQP